MSLVEFGHCLGEEGIVPLGWTRKWPLACTPEKLMGDLILQSGVASMPTRTTDGQFSEVSLDPVPVVLLEVRKASCAPLSSDFVKSNNFGIGLFLTRWEDCVGVDAVSSAAPVSVHRLPSSSLKQPTGNLSVATGGWQETMTYNEHCTLCHARSKQRRSPVGHQQNRRQTHHGCHAHLGWLPAGFQLSLQSFQLPLHSPGCGNSREMFVIERAW